MLNEVLEMNVGTGAKDEEVNEQSIRLEQIEQPIRNIPSLQHLDQERSPILVYSGDRNTLPEFFNLSQLYEETLTSITPIPMSTKRSREDSDSRISCLLLGELSSVTTKLSRR